MDFLNYKEAHWGARGPHVAGSKVIATCSLLALLAFLSLVACFDSSPTSTVAPTPAYTTTPTAISEPMTVPTPTSTHEPTAIPEQSGIAPFDPDDSEELWARLSRVEQDCITDINLLADFWSQHPAVEYGDVDRQMECLRDETILRLQVASLAWYFQDLGGALSVATASCIHNGLNGISMGALVREAHTAEGDLVRQAHSAIWYLTVWYCQSEEEDALAAPDSGITEDEHDGMLCVVEAFGGLDGLTDAYRTTDAQDFTNAFLTNSYGCP